MSGGIIGNNSQSTLLNSRFKLNNFSSYDVFGFCVAKNDLESNISQCIDENCLYQADNCSYCPRTYFNFSSSIEQLNFSCINVDSEWSWKIKNKTSLFIFVDINFFVSNTTFFEGNFYIQPNTSIVFNITDFGEVPFLNITGELQIDGKIELNIETKPTQSDLTILLFQYSSNNVTTGLKDSNIKLNSNYTDGKCDKIKHSVNDLPNLLFIQLKTNFGYCKKLLAIILGLSLGIPIFLVVIAVTVLFVMRKKLVDDALDFQKDNEMNKKSSVVWNSNDSNTGGQKWKEFAQI